MSTYPCQPCGSYPPASPSACLPACFRAPSLLPYLPACCPEAWLQVLTRQTASTHLPPSCLPACPPACAPRPPVRSLLVEQWPLALALLGGLLSLKITVISLLGPYFGLTRAESVRTGFVLSQVWQCNGLAAQEGWRGCWVTVGGASLP